MCLDSEYIVTSVKNLGAFHNTRQIFENLCKRGSCVHANGSAV